MNKIISSILICNGCENPIENNSKYYSIYDYDTNDTVDICTNCIDDICKISIEYALKKMGGEKYKKYIAKVSYNDLDFKIEPIENNSNKILVVKDKNYMIEKEDDIYPILIKELKRGFQEINF